MDSECLTCGAKIPNGSSIQADRIEVRDALQQHFWFKIEDCQNQILCDNCWRKIHDFHQFFCEVKARWNKNPELLELKMEQCFGVEPASEDSPEEIVFACELIKGEHDDEKPGETDGDQKRCVTPTEQETIYDKEDSSTEESSIPIQERLSKNFKKRREAADEFHSQRKKKRIATVVIEKKSTPNSERKFPCNICNLTKNFKRDEDLQVHKTLYHANEAEKVHKCNQCEKSFTTEWQLSGHLSWHKNVKNLGIFCEQCNKYFSTVRIKNAHIRAHHAAPSTKSSIDFNDNQDKPTEETSLSTGSRKKPAERVAEEDNLIRRFCTLLCELCDNISDTFSQLWKHYKNAHGQRAYAVCCGRKFGRKQMLYDHCLLHIDPKRFRCEECDKTFNNHEALEKHNQWVHTPDSEKPFKCEICDVAYFKKFLLRNHMKYHIAMEQKTFQCLECDKSFGTDLLLRSHQQNIHGASSSWVCEICAKGFVYQSLLEKHRLSHSAEGVASLKVQCEHCSKWLTTKAGLYNHLKRCQASGTATCDVCGKKLANQPALVRHKRDMHAKRPALFCNFCGKQFRQVLRLKEHEATHRGEILYNCPYCPMACNSSAVMHAHKKTVHAELWAARMRKKFFER
ncbi:zinc finger protein 62 homolog [Sabethes cyaneus]|uniref:zinc finger protein 62 homolog n=1 Tax=Sabethes cyaneus TaxID=53552 RepID=UPI00237E9CE4|nr:zinc finger protein 62 homolog [Sabethes cyaneus]